MNITKNIVSQGVSKYLFLWLGTLLIFTGACSKMDETYRDFWKDGEIVYPAIPDSVKVFPGKNRIKLQWILKGDASITNARIFWNAGNDSTSIPVNSTGGIDTVGVLLSDLNQGFYVFDILHVDDKKNTSLKVSTYSEIYGSNYENLLINRMIDNALFDNDTLKVFWQGFSDTTFIGSKLTYIDTSNVEKTLLVGPGETFTVLGDFDFDANDGFVKFSSMYMPHSTAIDTFYTAIDSVEAIGPPVLYSREGWTISATSVNDESCAAEKALDGDPNSYWWTGSAEEWQFPYALTIDMREIIDPVNGIFMQQRTGSNPRLDLFEIQISNDGINYTTIGMYNAADHSNPQFFDFMQLESFRYFKVLCHSVYRDKPRCSLAEVGIFYR
jgi:hypothetical protein